MVKIKAVIVKNITVQQFFQFKRRFKRSTSLHSPGYASVFYLQALDTFPKDFSFQSDSEELKRNIYSHLLRKCSVYIAVEIFKGHMLIAAEWSWSLRNRENCCRIRSLDEKAIKDEKCQKALQN